MDANSPPLDVAERITKLLRELLILVMGVYLAWYLIPLLPQFVSQLDGAKLTEVELGGIKLKLKEAEKALEAVVRTQAPEKGNVDEKASEQAKLVAQALDTVRSAAKPVQINSDPQSSTGSNKLPSVSVPVEQAYWVYVGAYRDGNWLTKYFNISGAINVGASMRATSDIYRRQSAPIYKDNDWLLGTPLGILQAGSNVTVRQVETVPGTGGRNLIWARVTSQ